MDPGELWGRVPAEFHEYLYDDDGRLIGAKVTREPRFTRDGVAMLLAHKQNVAEPRNRFGILMSEATDPANQFGFDANDSPLVDFSEKKVGEKQDAYYKSYPDAPRHGHLWSARKAD